MCDVRQCCIWCMVCHTISADAAGLLPDIDFVYQQLWFGRQACVHDKWASVLVILAAYHAQQL